MRFHMIALAVLACLGLVACDRPVPSSPSAPENTSQAEPTVGQKVEDATITAKVKAALLATENVNGTDISVETQAGRVILSGMVPDQGQIDRAVATARSVEGVIDVENRLAVGEG